MLCRPALDGRPFILYRSPGPGAPTAGFAEVSRSETKNYMFDPVNLLLFAAAVFMFWRLYALLGTRTGNERPPMDRLSGKPADAASAQEAAGTDAAPARLEDKSRAADGKAEEPGPLWKGYAAEGSAISAGLEGIAAADQNFAPRRFLEGAKLAYELIIESFAKGDKAALKPLLSADVFDGFGKAIDTRFAEGHKLETRFVGINKADVAGAEFLGNRASVVVRFVSEMISVTRNSKGEVIDGDPQEVREVTDVWTFERDVTSRDPNWKLAATEDPV